jgi:hypothetical protein
VVQAVDEEAVKSPATEVYVMDDELKYALITFLRSATSLLESVVNDEKKGGA